jgi:hypothetical protein
MILFTRRSRLPLGIDIDPNELSVVAAEMRVGDFTVKAAESRNIRHDGEAERDRAIVETLRALLRDLNITERRCVIAAPLGETQTRLFRLPPGMRRAEAERAALLEADSLVPWPSRERLVALDPIPGASEMLLSIARSAAVDRAARLVKVAGLEPVAVDVPLCVWRRAAPEADALLDLRRERAALFVFGEPLGTVERFPQTTDDRLIAQTRAVLIQARRDGIADVERVATIGPRDRAAMIESELSDDGYDAQPLTLGTSESPAWAFAYGLATWSVLSRERAA